MTLLTPYFQNDSSPLPIIQYTFGKLLNTLRLNYGGGGNKFFLKINFLQKFMQKIVVLRLYPKYKKSFCKPVARLIIGWSFSHIFGIHSNKQLGSVSTSCSSLNNLFLPKSTWSLDVLFRVTWSSFSLKAAIKSLIRIQRSFASAFLFSLTILQCLFFAHDW